LAQLPFLSLALVYSLIVRTRDRGNPFLLGGPRDPFSYSLTLYFPWFTWVRVPLSSPHFFCSPVQSVFGGFPLCCLSVGWPLCFFGGFPGPILPPPGGVGPTFLHKTRWAPFPPQTVSLPHLLPGPAFPSPYWMSPKFSFPYSRFFFFSPNRLNPQWKFSPLFSRRRDASSPPSSP